MPELVPQENTTLLRPGLGSCCSTVGCKAIPCLLDVHHRQPADVPSLLTPRKLRPGPSANMLMQKAQPHHSWALRQRQHRGGFCPTPASQSQAAGSDFGHSRRKPNLQGGLGNAALRSLASAGKEGPAEGGWAASADPRYPPPPRTVSPQPDSHIRDSRPQGKEAEKSQT